MTHAGHGMYESAQMEPIGKFGSVGEVGNTLVQVDAMGFWSVAKGNSNGGFSDVIQVR